MTPALTMQDHLRLALYDGLSEDDDRYEYHEAWLPLDARVALKIAKLRVTVLNGNPFRAALRRADGLCWLVEGRPDSPAGWLAEIGRALDGFNTDDARRLQCAR